jgi:hypothetical protein
MRKTTLLIALVILVACNEKTPTLTEKQAVELTKNDGVINKLLRKMYENDVKKDDPLSDASIFSKEIVALNEKCNAVTQKDIDRIAKSNYPTDKPLIREGSSATSLYEGATDFVIEKMIVNEKTMEIFVALSNKSDENHTMKWKDKLLLIDENGWKVDNIYFDKKLSQPDSKNPNLKENLISFSKQSIE